MLISTAPAADAPVVFITGAGSGMGRLAAQRALAAGWKVAALDLNARALEELGESPRLLKLPADVASAEAMREAAQRVERELGPIRRVLNAAAIMPLGLALEQAPETAQRIMTINYFGLVHVAHATLPAMLARGRGEFVSFSSMAGLMPTIYVAAYDASKFAVTAYTEVLAQENRGRGVRFACVCPPMVATPLLDQARATVWPRIFSLLPPLKPERVLDDIERALRRGRFWVLPGPVTALIAWCRRLSPGLVWWVNRLLERR